MRGTKVKQLKKELIEKLGKSPSISEFRKYKKNYVKRRNPILRGE